LDFLFMALAMWITNYRTVSQTRRTLLRLFTGESMIQG
jgi:hypothetical protein